MKAKASIFRMEQVAELPLLPYRTFAPSWVSGKEYPTYQPGAQIPCNCYPPGSEGSALAYIRLPTQNSPVHHRPPQHDEQCSGTG